MQLYAETRAGVRHCGRRRSSFDKTVVR